VQVIHSKINTTNTNQQALFNLFAAYLHTIPLEELIHRVERARRDAQLRHVVLYGRLVAIASAGPNDLMAHTCVLFALELKEQLALTFAACVTSILTQPHHLDKEGVTQPPLRHIVEMLQQVMCTHDAEKLAISVLELYDGHRRPV
jgi:hypothetical protein